MEKYVIPLIFLKDNSVNETNYIITYIHITIANNTIFFGAIFIQIILRLINKKLTIWYLLFSIYRIITQSIHNCNNEINNIYYKRYIDCLHEWEKQLNQVLNNIISYGNINNYDNINYINKCTIFNKNIYLTFLLKQKFVCLRYIYKLYKIEYVRRNILNLYKQILAESKINASNITKYILEIHKQKQILARTNTSETPSQ